MSLDVHQSTFNIFLALFTQITQVKYVYKVSSFTGIVTTTAQSCSYL